MRIDEIFRLSLLNILENKFKVVLTSIGIIVGAATIVLVIAVGRGGQMDVADQFKNLNAAAIKVTSSSGGSSAGGRDFGNMGGGMMPGGAMPGGGNREDSGGNNAMPRGEMPGGMFGGGFAPNLQTVNATLTEEDAEDIAFFVPDIAYSTISASGQMEVLGGSLEEAERVTVASVKPDYAAVSNLTLAVGDFITEEDEESKAKNCVLGYNLALSLFDSLLEAYDSVVTINDTSFVVAGVLQKMGTVSSGISPDEAVYVPYSSGAKYLFGRDINPQITVVAVDMDSVQPVMENIEILLGENYPGATFTISDAGSKMEAAQQSSRTLQVMLLAVAAIVFLVGGIGIMNVLFVSVKERTGEIGILKALGMQRSHVLLEFLFEAILIAVFGGVAGVVVGIVIMPLAERLGVRMEPIFQGYLMAFAFAVGCGTVFGFYPAWKASGLIPVEALANG